MRWIIIVLAVIQAGWMAFDGTRALVVGDYITPADGEYAGQLGPWAYAVSAIGIDPRSTLMKLIFALYGAAWLVLAALFAITNAAWSRRAMLAAAIGSLWYLPIGTVLAAVQCVLLMRRPVSR